MNESLELNPLEVYQATTMLQSGRPTKDVDALFFHGRSYGDYTDLFELANDLVSNRLVGKVLLFGNEGERVGSTIPYEANPGKTWCREQLREYGVEDDFMIDTPGGGYHTRWENDDFIRLCAQNEWKSGVILTQPHQLLRAMLGAVKVMSNQGYWMEIYTVTPTDTPWQEVVKGNQGMEAKPRVEHIKDELDRVAIYQKKGDLASFEELFRYLELRGRGLLRLGNLATIPQNLNDLQPDRLLTNFYSI